VTLAVGDAAHEELDFFGAQGAAVALFADDFLGEEHDASLSVI
jgi:hypothetical protein